MKNHFTLVLIALMFAITSCDNSPENLTGATPTPPNSGLKAFNPSHLRLQSFIIDNSIENTIEGAGGIKLKIPANTFVGDDGSVIEGGVTISLREVTSKTDIVMSNLTTTSNGQNLQTGGMFYLNATAQKMNLALAPEKSIEVTLPTGSSLENMSLFEGQIDSNKQINWVNPVELNDDTGLVGVDSLSIEKAHNITYTVEGFSDAADYPSEVISEVSRIAWAGDGLKIKRDSTFMIGEYTITFFKMDQLYTWSQTYGTSQGTNSFIEDRSLSYVFQLKKLGWANIDRLFEDPRTEEVELITNVTNHSSFDYVHTTMTTCDMYLPGYQKKDDSYSFTHGDFEKPLLPVGAKATIIATATKDKQLYFSYQTIQIKKNQTIALELKASSKSEMENTLSEAL